MGSLAEEDFGVRWFFGGKVLQCRNFLENANPFHVTCCHFKKHRHNMFWRFRSSKNTYFWRFRSFLYKHYLARNPQPIATLCLSCSMENRHLNGSFARHGTHHPLIKLYVLSGQIPHSCNTFDPPKMGNSINAIICVQCSDQSLPGSDQNFTCFLYPVVSFPKKNNQILYPNLPKNIHKTRIMRKTKK